MYLWDFEVDLIAGWREIGRHEFYRVAARRIFL